jgi:NIMA-interacting peptidyl-prolyl cis-trans isomerase 1
MISAFNARSIATFAVVLPLAFACGGGSQKATSPAIEDRSPSDECLARASAERTPPEGAPDRIEVSHILVKHKDLKRPEGATRTRGQACLRALEARSALEEGQDWNAVVDVYSDSGKSTNGELGTVSRDQVTETFGNTAFSLDVNELSYVVESDRGFHIIARTN